MPSTAISRAARAREHAIAVAAAAVAAIGWVVVVLTDSDAATGTALALWCGGFAAGVLLGAVNRVVSRGHLQASAFDAATVRRSDPLRRQGNALGLPGPWIWVAPLVLAVPMLAGLPFTPEARDGDWSPAVGIAFFVLLAAPIGLLGGVLAWLMGVMPPLAVLAAVLRRDGRAVVTSAATTLLLWGTVVFATTLVLGAPDLEAGSRSAQGPQLLALLGLDDALVVHPGLLWVARGAVVAIAAALVVLVRMGRGRAPRRAVHPGERRAKHGVGR